MRGRWCLLGVGLLVLAGCGDDPAVDAAAPVRVPPVVERPASSAGGACQMLEFPVVEEVTGTRFDVSAASRHKETHTCLLQAEGAAWPDLMLSVTATKADAEVFKEEMLPKGGRNVSELGEAGYRVTREPGEGHGAGAEVGWLTGDGRVLTLRYTFAADGDRSAADALVGKLVDLAKRLDVRDL